MRAEGVHGSGDRVRPEDVATHRRRTGRWALCLALLLALAAGPAAFAEDKDPKQDIVFAIKMGDTVERFEGLLSLVKGATEQQRLEAKLLYAMVREDPAYLATFAEKLPKDVSGWKSSEKVVLATFEEVQAVRFYLRALEARARGDAAAFEAAIKEAIWLDPDQDRFVEAVKQHRKALQTANLTVPMDAKLMTFDGKQVTLGDFAKDQKALYVQVWASWCGPCIKLFPELAARGRSLPAQGVAVVALNTEMDENNPGGDQEKASERRKQHDMTIPWLIESAAEPYRKPLEITSVPTALLLSPDGKVLYKGHPLEPGLRAALKKLNVELPAPKEPK